MELVGLSSEPFYQGIMASFSALAVLQILVFFGVLRFCARQPERLKFEKKPPLNLFSSNLSEQLKNVTSTTETCNWFNDLLSSVYFELLGSETMRKLVRESIEQELKELKEENPTLLDNLEVEHIDLGTHLPELRNVRVRSTDELKTDMFLVFDLSYTGGASISVKITSFGKSMSVNVSLSRIEGKLVAEIIDWPVPCIQMYFYSEPQFNFSLKFGEEKFKWFAEIVSQRLKQFLIKKVVYPNGLVYHFTRRGQEWHTMIKDRMPGSPDLLNQPGTLALHLYEAKGLQSGTYTAVARVNKQKYATKFREGASPVWNQTFCFDLRKLNPSETVITLQVRDSLKDKETSILGRVDIPLSSLRQNSAQFQSFNLLSAEADSQEVVGEIRIGFLVTTPEKTQFLSEISKFTKHQSMISMVKKANYDEKLGGYVMVTDGEKEEGCEPPTKSFLEGKRGSPDMDSLIKKTTMNFLHKLRNLDKKPAEKS